jgi:hypothetical protein
MGADEGLVCSCALVRCANRVRNKYLKPEGLMFPSHATILWALIADEDERDAKVHETSHAMQASALEGGGGRKQGGGGCKLSGT